ncbi:serine hydrolase domain-containing protein [Thermobifida halotolerans]|uniref:serine hydrolase domain-containing protein n=1 Tax=Thermobifida halotolerans TaxID=483545 RepID=UPI0008381487|nr:serine hydrolase domain-containing protein [Thermobifida halotolerans]
MSVPIDGSVEPRFAAVRDVLADLVETGKETGAGVSVWHRGREVVGLSAGWTDAARSRPWRRDTLVNVFSVGKPLAALAALVAFARRKVDLDTPVARLWPDYAAAGKERTTLRQMLAHQAGQPAFPASAAGVGALDDAGLRAALAAAAPEHRPGAGVAEHALTYGHLLDGAVRGAVGVPLAGVFAETVPERPGSGLWFGVPEESLHRVADLEVGTPHWTADYLADPDSLPARALTVPHGVLHTGFLNSTAWRRASFPAVGLHASASALGAFYASLTDGEGPVARLLGPALHAEYLSPQARGVDGFVGRDTVWTLGFQRDDESVGMGGIGGSAAWWSFRHGYALAYLTRRMADHSRVAAIADEVEKALGA